MRTLTKLQFELYNFVHKVFVFFCDHFNIQKYTHTQHTQNHDFQFFYKYVGLILSYTK